MAGWGIVETGGRRRGRTVARMAALVALAATAAGCWWPMPGQGPDRRAHNTAETEITAGSVASLHELWRADTESSVADPVTSDAGVHVNDGTTVYGFDEHGAPLWSSPLPPDMPVPPAGMRQVLARGDRVLASYGFGNLGGRWAGRWLDAATGAVEAEAGAYDTLRGDLAAGVTYGHGSGTPIGVRLSVVDLADPSRSWSGLLDVVSPGSGTLRPPTLGAEAVFHVGTGPAAGGANEPTFGVRAFPRAGGQSTCGPSQSPSFACPTWLTPLPGTRGGPAVLSEDQSTLYAGTDAGAVHALDARTGALLWSAPVGAAVTDAPALADGSLYVPTADGTLAVVPAAGCGASTCEPTWTASAGAGAVQQPAVAGGLVFTGSADGAVHAFPAAGCGAATCDPLWSADAGAEVTGAPAVNNGRLYVGTQDGLVAYGVGH